MKVRTLCERDSREHKLVVTKWKFTSTGNNHPTISAQHATQYLCEKCFSLFDHQDIADYYLEFVGLNKNCETSSESSCQDENEDDCKKPLNK